MVALRPNFKLVLIPFGHSSFHQDCLINFRGPFFHVFGGEYHERVLLAMTGVALGLQDLKGFCLQLFIGGRQGHGIV